jgi:hypothetical protein
MRCSITTVVDWTVGTMISLFLVNNRVISECPRRQIRNIDAEWEVVRDKHASVNGTSALADENGADAVGRRLLRPDTRDGAEIRSSLQKCGRAEGYFPSLDTYEEKCPAGGGASIVAGSLN